jgi:pimeloyl-ACP methyl ester carboxylesterase
MHLATDDGVSLHVQELGEGAPVILLHGLLLGNMTTWYWTAAPRIAERHRVILFDLRGHGLSERVPSGYDVAHMARDLESVVERLTREPVILVGHSYGAVVALTFALRHPERVRKLALVEAPLPPSRLAELDAFCQLAPDDMLKALPPELARALTGQGRRARRFVDSLRFLTQESSLLDDLRRAEDIPDDVLRTIDFPLLAVYGTDSSCRSVGARLARLVRGAEHVELAGGHFLPLETPGPLTDVLTRFIDA